MYPAEAIAIHGSGGLAIFRAVIAKCRGSLPQFGGVRSEHATFPKRAHVLVLAKGKSCGVSKRAYETSAIGRTLGLRAVLDQKEISFFRKLHDGFHVTRIASEVNHKDRPRLWSQDSSNRLDPDVLRVAVDVRKYRNCAAHHNATCRREKRTAAGDDVIARPNANTAQGKLESNRPVGYGNSMLRVISICKLAFKLPALLSGAVVHVAAAHYIGYCRDFVFSKVRPGRQRFGPHRHATVNSQDTLENGRIHVKYPDWERGIGIVSESGVSASPS